jgi:N,N-dimethylformamidase
MKIYGYADAWSVRQGEAIAFKVNSELGDYRADIVRLLQADDRTEGPGYRETEIDAACNGEYPGRVQKLRPGSCLRVADAPALAASEGLTITAWIYATTPGRGAQGVLSKTQGIEGPGYSLFVDAGGEVAFRIADASGEAVVRSGAALLERRWTFLAASWDAASGALQLIQATSDALSPHWVQESARQSAHGDVSSATTEADLVIAALGGGEEVGGHFNGKIDRPRVFARALSEAEIAAIGEGGAGPTDAIVAAWDFAATPFGLSVPDAGPNRLDAEIVNNPMRAVTDHAWDASTSYYAAHPEHYAAIYFHDDDIDDAGWNTDFVYEVPKDLPSGVYAARLRAGGEEDYIPFVVRPAADAEHADILFLLPSFLYMAYANERFHAQDFVQWDLASDHPLRLSRQDAFVAENGAMLSPSTYDAHTDGSYCCTVSRLKPILNWRPKLTAYWTDAGRHLGADMYLVDWLDRKGFRFDVVTDEDLDAEGADLLAPYRVVLLGSHPEYFSHEMHKAFESYLGGGGNLMNMGGNGAWWVTSRDPVRPHVIEVRKEDPWGLGAMGVAPGERYHQTTGTFGGGWRGVGKGPERLFGSGYTSQGFCKAEPYRRQPESTDPRVTFIFEGIAKDETIGDFGLAMGGAAGDEFDCLHTNSPPNTLKLASSSDHSELCLNFSMPYEPIERQKASVRADISYYEPGGGGAVFATGSMCWCPALPHNDYDNNVSRITENVLRRFAGA